MKNVRLVVNTTKDGATFTLHNLKVVIEDGSQGTALSSLRSYDSTFSNPSALFSEIQSRAIEVFNSILNN